MKAVDFTKLVLIVLFSSLMLLAGLYLLAKFNKLFKRQVKNELLRKNIAVWLIAICLVLSITPTTHDFESAFTKNKLLSYFLLQSFAATIEALFVFNISWAVIKFLNKKKMTFRKRMGIILFEIIISTMVIGIPINYLVNKFLTGKASFKNIQYTLLFNFYTGCMTGLVYITMNYVDLERKRELNEKELEVSRLQGLKTKAELEALHSKINPHF